MNVANSVGWIIFFLPRLSARNPHKCELHIIPKNEIALNTPFSLVVNFKSHDDTGIINETPHVSSTTLINIIPLTNITI